MCDGKALFSEIEHWVPFTSSAQHEHGPFSSIPAHAGVYALRVSKVGTADPQQIKNSFSSSSFMKSCVRVDAESDALFAELGLGKDRGWRFSKYHGHRLERIDRISFVQGALACPLLYIGKANSLYRRFKELAFYGHTINAPLWALLMSGWKFDVGFKMTEKKAETAEEARLKDIYRGMHGNNLPPLVDR